MATYDDIKQFGGKRYTGMQVGRSHTWRYDAGEWKERKVTPDRWEFRYAVTKRRAGRAPEGSGAPVGTAYHWYIVADQVVTKLDANSYSTEMVGHKLKLAHRRADREAWSGGERARRNQLVKLLRELADDLESRPLEPPAVEHARPARRAPVHRTHTARAPKRSPHRVARTKHATRARPARSRTTDRRRAPTPS
jgi:hypothetical protein